jgi:hypothetical protein
MIEPRCFEWHVRPGRVCCGTTSRSGKMVSLNRRAAMRAGADRPVLPYSLQRGLTAASQSREGPSAQMAGFRNRRQTAHEKRKPRLVVFFGGKRGIASLSTTGAATVNSDSWQKRRFQALT